MISCFVIENRFKLALIVSKELEYDVNMSKIVQSRAGKVR